MSDWLQDGRVDAGDGRRAAFSSRAVTERDLLTGASFALTAEASGGAGGLVSLWGRGAVLRFDGREGDLSLDGEVASAMLGADWTRDAWTTGLLLSHSRGEGGYRGAGAGTVSSSMTGLYPYGRTMVNERVTLWGVAGYGAGTLTLTLKNPGTGKDDGTIRTDMDLAMAALGVRGVAVEAPTDGGFELAVTSDGMVVRTSSEKVTGLEAAEAEVTRLRLGLEGSWRGLALGGGALRPRLEVGVRHDGGDAETGFGLDLGGGLAWSHPANGVWAEMSGRALLTHESRGFRDRGLSGSFAWDPGQGSGRGPRLSLTQTMGPRPGAAWTRCSGGGPWRGWRPTTTGTSWRTAGWSSSWATASGRSATGSRRRRSSGWDCPTGTGTTAWLGAWCATGGAATSGRWSSPWRHGGARAPTTSDRGPGLAQSPSTASGSG